MTSQYQRIRELIDNEIAFHSEHEEPWYWRFLCQLFGRYPTHEVVVSELQFLSAYLNHPGTLIPRTCGDCGEEFDPVTAIDWWCKKCLIKRYNSMRPSSDPQSDERILPLQSSGDW